mgnify:CR=1 FL=1
MNQRAQASSFWRGKRLVLLSLFLLVLAARPGFAQRSLGYGFVAANSSPSPGAGLHYGIGGAAGVSRRVALGGEIGRLHTDYWKGVLGSVNVTVHVRSTSRSERLDPFVTGGLSGLYLPKTKDYGVYLNLGLGAHYWFRSRLGVRAEVRAYPPGVADINGFSEFRLGIAFK